MCLTIWLISVICSFAFRAYNATKSPRYRTRKPKDAHKVTNFFVKTGKK